MSDKLYNLLYRNGVLLMKIRKFLTAVVAINLVVVLLILIGGFRYIMKQGEAQIIAVDINSKKQTIEIKQDDFVDVRKYIPDIMIELRYATKNNITKSVLYENTNTYLRRGTADKLKEANYEFKKLGYRIKIWDAYRPTSVQKLLWKKVSDNRYIANPSGGSNHNRGAAVDVTLVDKNGREIAMPTDFDGFSKQADKDYDDVEKNRAENAKLLERIMIKCGFESIYTEWWHFDDSDWNKYSIVDRVTENSVSTVYDNSPDNPEISGKASVSSESDFIEKLRAGINNINIGKIKTELEYEIFKLKNIFRNYKANE